MKSYWCPVQRLNRLRDTTKEGWSPWQLKAREEHENLNLLELRAVTCKWQIMNSSLSQIRYLMIGNQPFYSSTKWEKLTL